MPVQLSRLICGFYFTRFEFKKNIPCLIAQKTKLCHYLLSKSYMHFYSFYFEYKSCARVAPYTKRTLSDRQGITQNYKYD